MNTLIEPSACGMRAATALSDSGKLHRQPESYTKLREAARMIDRETGAADLLAALESIEQELTARQAHPDCYEFAVSNCLYTVSQALEKHKARTQ